MNAKRQILAALAGISVVAAVGSYLQALVVVQAADGRGVVSYFVAGLADPTVYAAIANIYDARRSKTPLPPWSCVSVAVALVVTCGANVMAGHPYAVPAWLVRLWPPVAFLMALESLMSYARRHRKPAADDSGDQCPHKAAATMNDAIRLAYEHDRDCLGKESYRDVGRRFGVHHSKVAELVAAASPNGDGPHE